MATVGVSLSNNIEIETFTTHGLIWRTILYSSYSHNLTLSDIKLETERSEPVREPLASYQAQNILSILADAHVQCLLAQMYTHCFR